MILISGEKVSFDTLSELKKKLVLETTEAKKSRFQEGHSPR